MKQYIIVGDNNYWYATLSRKADIQDAIDEIKEQDNAPDKAEMVYVFEAKDVGKYKI